MRKPFEISPEAAGLLKRINQASRMNGVTIARIASELGTYPTTINNQLTGKHALDIRVLLIVSRLCPNVSAEWLLCGTGDIISKMQQENIAKT